MSGHDTKLESAQLGAVEVTRLRGEVLTVRAATPRPPGTRVGLAEPGSPGQLVQGKVTSVRAANPGPDAREWEIEIKLFAPSRAARTRLAELSASRTQ
jgi:hypothetical protein